MPNSRSPRYRCRFARLTVLLVGLAVCSQAFGQPAAAPNYKEYPVNASLKGMLQDVTKSLRDDSYVTASKAAFDNYFTKYALPRWTLAANRLSLPARRMELRNLLSRAKPGTVHTGLVTLALAELVKMTQDTACHPIVRYNAMLMIGDLNATESPRASQPPVPSPGGLTELLGVVAPGTNDPQLELWMREGALVGLVRHARIGIPAANRQAVTVAMLKMVQDQTQPGPAGSGIAWMRGQAAEVLGHMGSPGPNESILTALTAMVADAQLPIPVRCRAAVAIGRLKYQTGQGINPMPAAAALGRLALDACNAEVAARRAGRNTFRRRLLPCIDASMAGLDELTPLATQPAQQQPIAALRAAMTKIQTALGTRNFNDETLVTTIEADRAALQAAVGQISNP